MIMRRSHVGSSREERHAAATLCALVRGHCRHIHSDITFPCTRRWNILASLVGTHSKRRTYFSVRSPVQQLFSAIFVSSGVSLGTSDFRVRSNQVDRNNWRVLAGLVHVAACEGSRA